jgi:hypothetical protein
MRSQGGTRRLSRGLGFGAIALFASVALFIAAPSTWGNGVVDHGGRVTQDTTQSITAPHSVAPSGGHNLHAAAHTLVIAVLIVALGFAVIGCTRRRDLEADDHVTSRTLLWVQRRGPPWLV